MKKRFFYWTLCLSLLLSGCGGSADPAPDVPESPLPAETPVAAPDAPADLSDAVFDTAQDAGRLTARYLSLTQMYSPAGQEIPISTGDSTVYTSPEGQVLLVDCGNALGGQEVVDQLRRMDVSQIDVLVCPIPMPTISAVSAPWRTPSPSEKSTPTAMNMIARATGT